MISVDRLLPYILPFADSCPKAVARVSVIKAAQELCVHSLVWQTDAQWEFVKPFDCEVRFTPPSYADIVKIMCVSFNGMPLAIANANQLFNDNPGWHWGLKSGVPSAVIQTSLGSIKLVPCPTKAGVVAARIALAPRLDSEELPDDLYTRFWPTIVNGALADIKQMEGQTFSNLQSAMAYRALFVQGVRDARVEANRSLGRFSGKVKTQRIV